jgi:four helix bundle protein
VAGARTFDELDAWRLSADLRDRIFQETRSGVWLTDLRFREQLRDASASAPRNIAEGFGAYAPREFARFTRIARRSLVETQSHLLDARGRGYLSPERAADLLTLSRRALAAITGLLKYLESCDGHAPTGWHTRGSRRG